MKKKTKIKKICKQFIAKFIEKITQKRAKRPNRSKGRKYMRGFFKTLRRSKIGWKSLKNSFRNWKLSTGKKCFLY